jgi:hypothetical protein
MNEKVEVGGAYHSRAVGFGSRTPHPLVTVGYRSEEYAFATQELTLAIGTTNQQIIASGVSVWHHSAHVESQRFLGVHLHFFINFIYSDNVVWFE